MQIYIFLIFLKFDQTRKGKSSLPSTPFSTCFRERKHFCSLEGSAKEAQEVMSPPGRTPSLSPPLIVPLKNLVVAGGLLCTLRSTQSCLLSPRLPLTPPVSVQWWWKEICSPPRGTQFLPEYILFPSIQTCLLRQEEVSFDLLNKRRAYLPGWQNSFLCLLQLGSCTIEFFIFQLEIKVQIFIGCIKHVSSTDCSDNCNVRDTGLRTVRRRGESHHQRVKLLVSVSLYKKNKHDMTHHFFH